MNGALQFDETCPVSGQTYREDIVCAVFQGVSLFLWVGGISVLISLAGVFGDAWRIVSFSIYGATLIIAYLSSTIYHGTRHLPSKRVFKVIDHANIHLLIAGTYTPFALVTLNGGWGWSLFGVVWGLCLVGVVLKVVFQDRYGAVSVLLYLGMGWLVLVAAVPLLETLPTSGFTLLMVGGATYSVGVIFYLWQNMPYNHAVWHGFVFAGSAFFYFVNIFYVLF